MIAVALLLYILGAAITVLLIEAVEHNCSPLRYFSVVTFWPIVSALVYLHATYCYVKGRWDNRNDVHN